MKVWITKYALTSGIREAEAVPTGVSLDMILVPARSDTRFPEHFHGQGREWHMLKENAVARAEAMRTAKIASLRKQIAKLEKLRFE